MVSHPALYGWNWNYALGAGSTASASSAAGHVPPQAVSLLERDRAVAAWSGVSFGDVQIDGQTAPVILASTHARVSPPVLSGHPLEAGNQIVLGADRPRAPSGVTRPLAIRNRHRPGTASSRAMSQKARQVTRQNDTFASPSAA